MVWFLDRHQVWRSHDPRSVRLLTFVKKVVIPPFLKKTHLFVFPSISFTSFKKMQLFVIRIYFFHILKKRQLYCTVLLLLVIILLIIRPVIWCFPIWLTSSLSYPMAIFSANEIRTFFFISIKNYCNVLYFLGFTWLFWSSTPNTMYYLPKKLGAWLLFLFCGIIE